jgi:sugar phosphate isomerase/epimerase
LIQALKVCASHAEQHGVIVALQHHHDFLKTAEETLQVIRAVDSPWCGIVLDVGSLRDRNVYEEIELLLPYTTTWQIKEQVWVDGEQVPADLGRIAEIIDRLGYRGFLPIEVLGKDSDVDTRKRRTVNFLNQVRKRMIG